MSETRNRKDFERYSAKPTAELNRIKTELEEFVAKFPECNNDQFVCCIWIIKLILAERIGRK